MGSEIFKVGDYKGFIQEIKQRIQAAQIKAAVTVNREMLQLYWELGQRMIHKQQETAWGDGFIKQMSKDLKEEFPEMKGFSERNLKYMRQWAQFWLAHPAFAQQVAAQLGKAEIGQQLVAQFTQIPWGQNLVIMMRARDHAEALFYVDQDFAGGV